MKIIILPSQELSMALGIPSVWLSPWPELSGTEMHKLFRILPEFSCRVIQLVGTG